MEVKPQVGDRSLNTATSLHTSSFDKPEGAQIVRHRSRSRSGSCTGTSTRQKVATPAVSGRPFDGYLRRAMSNRWSLTTGLRKLCADIVPRPGNPLQDITAVMNWVNTNFKYDHMDASLARAAVHALERRLATAATTTVCARSAGRWASRRASTYGINPFAEEFAVALQARSVPAAVRLGQLRRFRDAKDD